LDPEHEPRTHRAEACRPRQGRLEEIQRGERHYIRSRQNDPFRRVLRISYFEFSLILNSRSRITQGRKHAAAPKLP
jgi:hypothetical protein